MNVSDNTSGDNQSDSYYTQGLRGDIKFLVPIIVTDLLSLISTFAVIGIVGGGMMMVLSGGAEEKMKKGKNIVVVSLTAIIISLLAYAMVSSVSWFINLA